MVVITFMLGAGGSAWAQFPMPLGHLDQGIKPEDIRELVSKYCRLDYEGARLDVQGWQKLQPLVWWRSNPDFAQISVITRYTVSSTPESEHGRYSVSVHYLQIGRFEPGVGYTREATTNDAEYSVTSSGGEWRINDANPNFPHTSKPAMIAWLNSKLKSETDDASKKIYQDALRQLQAPATPPSQ